MVSKLPLTKPVYMAEVGRRMGVSTREARRILRRIEWGRKVKIIFDSRKHQQGHLWTTEALLLKYCPELVDRPRRALGEVRQFSARVSEKVDDIKKTVDRLEDKLEQELSEVRGLIQRIKKQGHT